MKFLITRASKEYSATVKPAEKAFAVRENGFIRWYVEISSIEDLVALINEEGADVIVSKDDIMIYDAHVE